MGTMSIEDYKRRLEEAREIRRRSADWDFIEKQPEPMKTALKLLTSRDRRPMVLSEDSRSWTR